MSPNAGIRRMRLPQHADPTRSATARTRARTRNAQRRLRAESERAYQVPEFSNGKEVANAW
jgi:hypothetical protein